MALQEQQSGLRIPQLAGQMQQTGAAPNAVTAMEGAFKQGLITADDIAERLSQRSALKKRLELETTKNALAAQELEPAILAAKRAELEQATLAQPIASAQAMANLQSGGQNVNLLGLANKYGIQVETDDNGIPTEAGLRDASIKLQGVVGKKPVDPKNAAEVKNELVALDEINGLISNARNLIRQPGIVGPIAGTMPVQLFNQMAAGFGYRGDEFEGQRTMEMLVSRKVLEGAQKMKGNLSDKDIRFLQATVPKLTDKPELWDAYLRNWELTNEHFKKILSGQLPPGTELNLAGAPAAAPASAPAPAGAESGLPSDVVEVPNKPGIYFSASTGKYFRRNAAPAAAPAAPAPPVTQEPIVTPRRTAPVGGFMRPTLQEQRQAISAKRG